MMHGGNSAIGVASLSGAMRDGPALRARIHPCGTRRSLSVLGEFDVDAYDCYGLALLEPTNEIHWPMVTLRCRLPRFAAACQGPPIPFHTMDLVAHGMGREPNREQSSIPSYVGA